MRWLFSLLVLTCGLAALPALAQPKIETSEKRVALVIGIGKYQTAPTLANPPNDARRIAETLRRLNFDVEEAIDPDFATFTRKLREFDTRAQKADAALIFYAGHGVQVDRENYLIPADAKLERERDLYYEAIPLDLVLGAVSQATRVGIVLLDACRNNPFTERVTRSFSIAERSSRSAAAGLARVDNVPRNTVVVMSTRANEIAEDGSGEDSPFTQALLAHFRIPGLELSLFFRSVRDTVLKATNNRQEPYVFSSLGAEPFYFFPRPPDRPPVVGAIKPLEVTDAAGPTSLGVPRPVSPNDDPMTVHVIGLPRSGEIRIDGKPVATTDTVSLDKFMSATYKPDGKVLGSVGTFDYMVDDGRGGTSMGVLPISVVTSHHAPVVEPQRIAHVYVNYLNIAMPTSAEGDPLTITVQQLPVRGVIRNGTTALRIGDKIRVDNIGGLTYWPEPGTTGDVGALIYSVENGHGGSAQGKVDLQIAGIDDKFFSDADLWQRIDGGGGAADVSAFLQLFPTSPLADAAKQRLKQMGQAPAPVASATQAAQPAAAAVSPQRVATTAAIPPLATSRNAEGSERTFQDCPNCPVMVKVPGGTFMMGSSSSPEALPQHRVSVRPFAVAEHPVTVAEWRECMAGRGCGFMPRMAQPSDETPVHNVSWEDAQAYVAWLSVRTGRQYRLPSEAEWEYAARANTTTNFWWGNEAGVGLANCSDCGGKQQASLPLPVETFKPNQFGLYDMNGGVAEWVADCWRPNYQNAPSDGTAVVGDNCDTRVLRGGSFRAAHDAVTAFARWHYDAAVRYITNGFRVAAAQP